MNLIKEIQKELDAIREVRNKFIHQIDRDLSEEIKSTLSKLVADTDATDLPNELITVSLKKLSELVSIIEKSYNNFLEEKGL